MDNNQLLTWWQTLHSCNTALDWITIPLGVLSLALIYIRVRAGFLLIFIVANVIEVIPRFLDAVSPPSPGRAYEIGVLVEGLWFLSVISMMLAAVLCVKWFRGRVPAGSSLHNSQKR